MTVDRRVALSAADRPTSLDGFDTTALASGHLAILSAGDAKGSLYRLDKASTAAADGVAVIAPLQGPGRWLLMQDGLTDSEAIPQPFQPNVQNNQSKSSETNYTGAFYWLERVVTFNRLLLNIENLPAGDAPGRVLLYQAPDGVFANSLPLVATFDFTATVTGRTAVAPVSGSLVALARGVFWLLIGSRDGANPFAFSVYDTNDFPLFNDGTVAPSDKPTQFDTNIAATTAPATFDPRLSGDADSVEGQTIPVIRLITV